MRIAELSNSVEHEVQNKRITQYPRENLFRICVNYCDVGAVNKLSYDKQSLGQTRHCSIVEKSMENSARVQGLSILHYSDYHAILHPGGNDYARHKI